MVAYAGHFWNNILNDLAPKFAKCETTVVHQQTATTRQAKSAEDSRESQPSGLAKYSLRGNSDYLKAQAVKQVFVIMGIAILGQITAIYSKYNSGKTLFVIHQLIESINNGRIKAEDVFYFNLDDNLNGLAEKVEVAEEVGFHMISDGYKGFRIDEFTLDIEALCENGQARGVIVILDTGKKAVDLMDKKATSRFTQIMRRFAAKGGTVIILAHVNKKPGADGKPVHAGTSDLVDDADCAFIMDVVRNDLENQNRIVQLENIKRRGNVAMTKAFQYSITPDQTYEELLASVSEVDGDQIDLIKKREEEKPEQEVIACIRQCIQEGIRQKMQLRDIVNERTGTGKNKVIEILNKYTGKDPDQHKWYYTVQEHGRKVFGLLEGRENV